jgi:hypothetical protein
MLVATNESSNQVPTTPSLSVSAASNSTGLPFDEEAKLVYGVVISLRNMIKKISGRYLIPSSITDDTTQDCSLATSNLSITALQDTSFTYLKPSQVTSL